MWNRARVLVLVLWQGAILGVLGMGNASAQDDEATAAVRKSSAQVVAAFNEGKVDDLTGMFLPKGELVDEQGNVYLGRQEIKDLFEQFFKKFPGASVTNEVGSIRLVGPIAIEEGTRSIAVKDGSTKSQLQYLTLWSKGEKDWQIASTRDFEDVPAPTPHELLQPLAFLVGEWVNEGADGKVSISYRWSEDKNFLLGDFAVRGADDATTKSTQRIGWDPQAGRIRSWLFDADGGFAEGQWTQLEGEFVVKSSSVNPDGTSSSATMTIAPGEKDRYTIKGTDRIVGNERAPDFELTVVRRPPTPGK